MRFFTSLLFIAICCTTFAQKKENINVVYNRSSLALFLLEEETMPQKDIIVEAFKNSPFPDKFNDHNLDERSFSVDVIEVTDDDHKLFSESIMESAPAKKSGGAFGSLLKGAASDASGGVVSTNSKELYAVKSHKYFLENNVAKQMLDKWFLANDPEQGSLSQDLIFERGLYGASQADIEKAKQTVLGMDLLKNAGYELLNNSFVVACHYRYMDKDEVVALVSQVITAAADASENAYAQMAAKAATVGLKASLGAGYYVVTTSYLFKLHWDEEVENKILSSWDDIDQYHELNIGDMKYIGSEMGWANVKAGIFTDKTPEELISIATVNSTDAVIAKLEKKYDVFKTKTPLIVNEDGTMHAFIGLKEGLEAKDKFEVLEKIQSPDGKISYKRKGVITVTKNKDKIWDNRYMADQEPDHNAEITSTAFDGFKKDYFTGMLIRQIK